MTDVQTQRRVASRRAIVSLTNFARSQERPCLVGYLRQPKELRDRARLRSALLSDFAPMIHSGRHRTAFRFRGESRFPRETVVFHG